MTKISYVAGAIGADEYKDRAAELKPQPFIPYLSMTQGEMELALLQEQANILANYYGSPKYKEAETMLQNTLARGLHGSTPYLGAYNPELRPLARIIATAQRNTRPASNAAFLREGGIGQGIHIGDPIIDFDARGKQCLKWAESANSNAERKRRVRECEKTWRIEKIINDGVENCGQYLAYGFLPSQGINGIPTVAALKLKTQEIGQQDIARVGKFSVALTQQWLTTGMMRRNVDTAKVQPYGWEKTNAILTALPEAGQRELLALFTSLKKAKTGGATISQTEAGRRMTAIIRKYNGSGVGEPVTVTIAIIGAVTALIKAISEFAKQAKVEEEDAFAQVNGFGTRGIGPETGDWDGDGVPNAQDQTAGTPGQSAGGIGPETGDWDGDGVPNAQDQTAGTPGQSAGGIDPLLLVGGGLAAYLLLK